MPEKIYSKEQLQSWSTVELGSFYANLYMEHGLIRGEIALLEPVVEVLRNRKYDETYKIYSAMCKEMNMYFNMGDKGAAHVVKMMKDKFLDDVINGKQKAL